MNLFKTPSKKSFIFLNIFYIILIFVALFTELPHKHSKQGKVARDYTDKYVFTNPILDYEEIEMDGNTLYHQDLNKKVESLIENYKLQSASIYFRDLNNGQWAGVNEKEPFASASLMKLPIFYLFGNKSKKIRNFLKKKSWLMVILLTPYFPKT